MEVRFGPDHRPSANNATPVTTRDKATPAKMPCQRTAAAAAGGLAVRTISDFAPVRPGILTGGGTLRFTGNMARGDAGNGSAPVSIAHSPLAMRCCLSRATPTPPASHSTSMAASEGRSSGSCASSVRRAAPRLLEKPEKSGKALGLWVAESACGDAIEGACPVRRKWISAPSEYKSAATLCRSSKPAVPISTPCNSGATNDQRSGGCSVMARKAEAMPESRSTISPASVTITFCGARPR